MKPTLSILIPCRNEEDFLGACLDSILASDYPASLLEVLVADGMSTDGTRALLARTRFSNLRMIDNPERIASAGLNRALEAARGEIIVRLDAHSTIASDYLSRAVDYLESHAADNVGGAMQTIARDHGLFANAIQVALAHPFGVGNSHFRTARAGMAPRWVDTVFGGCWRREVFDRIGKFNEKLVRGQDLEFNIRLAQAGGRILLAPDVHSLYYARATFKSFVRHNWTNGVWALLPFAYSTVIPVRLRHLIPMCFATALAVSASLSGFSPTARWTFTVILGAYAALNLIASAATAWKRRDVKLLVLLPVTFAGLHLAYGAGSVWGGIRLLGIVLGRGVSKWFWSRPEPA